MKRILAAIACLGINGAAAQATVSLPCAESDRECAGAERLKSPAKKLAFWAAAMRKPVAQRVGPAPEELLRFINLDNIAAGYPNRPRTPQLSAEFLRDLNDAIAELPPFILDLIAPKLVGIYLVSDLGGTAYCDYVDGGFFHADAGWIVLDADVLARRTANEWATWKENTPFRQDPAYRLDAIIESVQNDSRKNAIRYILLHEIGHVLSIGGTIQPRWDALPSSVDRFPFAKLSWVFDSGQSRYASIFDASFPERKDVVYYFGAKLEGKTQIQIYERLEHTSFPTLYAATHPGDDFAESFASYVHTVLQKRPWKIRLTRDGKLAKTFAPCWDEKRCAEKRKFLEEFLGLK